MDSLRELLLDNMKLPSPPNIALRLLETLKRDDFSYSEIAKIIQSDPALAVKVLKAANSDIYSLPDKTTSIERALAILGTHVVKNIALSFTLADDVNLSPEHGFNINYFWKRSIIAAIGAELFSNYLQFKEDDIFITALFQDLGVLILYSRYSNEYSKLIEEKNSFRIPFETLEKRTFGFTHEELGSEILREWGLPENIYVPIRYHHNYCIAPEQHKKAARILHLSHAFSSIFNDESFEKIQHFAGIIKDDLAIADSVLESLVDKAGNRIMEICSMFDIPSGDVKSLSRLLQEANEELSGMNLSYEKLLAEYKKEKMQAEKLTREVQETNERLNEANYKLQETSVRDYLTGLYNRRFLFDFLDKEVSRAQRYGGYFSILMLDIDYFKKINDTYGHHSGDLVLTAMGKKTLEMKRSSDIVARYGGEEFVIVLPQTDLGGAVAFAERLRKAIESLEIPADDRTLNITASIGVATYDPETKLSANEIINAADKALYEAKNSGRNRVAAAGRWNSDDGVQRNSNLRVSCHRLQ
jgi:diguanylate cyclase (GGDEF)-like protein